MRYEPEQITIDGPAASGKSTAARRVAVALGVYYLDTGAMYRALTCLACARGVDPATDPEAMVEVMAATRFELLPPAEEDARLQLMVNGAPADENAIRTPAVTRLVSYTARIPAVRDWMLQYQYAARDLGTIVVEGRDIGTVIFPAARHKFYITATPEERARRRLAQSEQNVDGATVASVAADIRERDHIDSTRPVAPLKPAADALLIDTTGLSVDAVVTRIVDTVRERWRKDRPKIASKTKDNIHHRDTEHAEERI